MYSNFLKRFVDVSVSLMAIIILALPMAIIAVLVKLQDGGPAIFKQERLGKGGKSFYILKFRTMIVDAEKSGVYSDNKDPRVTKIGNFLRKTSLDELPQFINILKGDMSFIGPRPPLTDHPWPITEYTEEQFKMFDVRPGITGWAQINGRKAVEWNKRIELNVWYVENISLALDTKILFKTFFKVISAADNENIGATVVAKEKVKTRE